MLRKALRRPALLAALGLGVAACAADPRPVPRPVPAPVTKPVSFSVLEDYDKGDDLAEVARDFRLMQELGVTTWRGSIGWDDYEPEPGAYDFGWLHAFAELAAAHGITLRPYIAFTAPWAADGGRADDQYWNDPPAELDAWYGFVHALASALRRHPNVVSYEIYNEADVALWWDGGRATYGRVLARGAEAVRAADPDAAVLPGGTTVPDADWLAAACRALPDGVRAAAAAFHAYPETWSADTVTVENFLEANGYRRYAAAAERVCGGPEVWINEMGFATTPGRTEAAQAHWWARAVATFLAVPEVQHIGIYEIKDLPTDEPVIGDAPNHHLGLTRTDRTKKLAFHTVDLLTDLLDVSLLTVADRELTVHVAAGRAGTLHRHLFRRPDGRQVVFVWDAAGRPTVDLTLQRPGAAAVEYALDGTPSRYTAFDGATLRHVRLEPGVVRIFEIRP